MSFRLRPAVAPVLAPACVKPVRSNRRSWKLPRLALLSLLLAWAGTTSALMNSPKSGTLSTTTPSLNFSGTTPAGVNPIAIAEIFYPCPTGIAECDSYTLTTNLPAGGQVRVSLDWSVAGDDYDLYVYDAAGSKVAGSSAGGDKPEVLVFTVPAGAGTRSYFVDVVPFVAVNNTYTGTIALVTGGGGGGGGFTYNGDPLTATCSIPAPVRVSCAGSGDPDYGVYPAPTAINDALFGAGEPTLDINYGTGSIFLRFSGGTARLSFAAGLPVWTNVSDPYTRIGADSFLTSGYAVKSNGIPDASTPSRIFTLQLLAVGSAMAYSDDDGASWLPADAGGIPHGADNESVAAGPYPANSRFAANPAFPYAVYYCSHGVINAFCSRSDTGGQTFNPSSPIFPVEQVCNNHGHVKVGPDGTVYVPMNNPCLLPALIGGQVGEGLAISTDAGLTWKYLLVPGTAGGRWDSAIAIARDGKTVYYAYGEQDDVNGDRQRVLKGTLVKTAGTPGCTPAPCIAWDAAPAVDLATPAGLKNTVFSTVVAGDADRATVIFHATTRAGHSGVRGTSSNPGMASFDDNGSPQKAENNAVWHLWSASTFDGGQTWKLRAIAPSDPTQRGSICDQGTTCSSSPDERNLLDFIDAVVDPQGNVVISFADGCTGTCANGSGPANFSNLGTIARQIGGPAMYADPNVAGPASLLPAITLAPSPLSFGNQAVSTGSAEKIITLTNSGSAPLTISAVQLLGAEFKRVQRCPPSLAPGAHCEIGVTFKPATTGERSGTLLVASNASGSPHQVKLTGTGVAPVVSLSLAPTALAFGRQAVNASSAQKSITLTNTGTAPLSIRAIKAAGPDFVSTHVCPTTLAPGAQCSIGVSFKPVAAGSRTGTLNVVTDAPSSPNQVSLTGIGVAAEATLNAVSLQFGDQAVGQASTEKIITITNTGNSNLVFRSIQVVGADFSRVSRCPATLVPGAQCEVGVRFKPVTTGNRSGTLSIVSNTAGLQNTVDLSGKGV